MRRASSHLLIMMLVATGVFAVGVAQKAPCATESFRETQTSRFPCYSDLSWLVAPEQLASGRVPYLDPCAPSSTACDEYPVLTMLVMFGAARTSSDMGFYTANVAVMFMCLLATVWALERMGARTLLFAAAPALALYGALNWDLIAVASATLATYLLLRGRRGWSGVALGIGAAAKLYPALLVFPFVLHLFRQNRKGDAARLAAAAAATWIVINMPFALGGTAGWLEVFQFNRLRGVDFESLWRIPCELGVCLGPGALNLLIPFVVAAATWLVWRAVISRVPNEPRWFLAFPLLVFVVVSGKFWSPQYALWLLPWFALSRVPVRVWMAYQLSEVLEFTARSGFMMFSPGTRIPLPWVLVTVAIRAALLLRCLWWWTRDPEPAPGTLQDGYEMERPILQPA